MKELIIFFLKMVINLIVVILFLPLMFILFLIENIFDPIFKAIKPQPNFFEKHERDNLKSLVDSVYFSKIKNLSDEEVKAIVEKRSMDRRSFKIKLDKEIDYDDYWD